MSWGYIGGIIIMNLIIFVTRYHSIHCHIFSWWRSRRYHLCFLNQINSDDKNMRIVIFGVDTTILPPNHATTSDSNNKGIRNILWWESLYQFTSFIVTSPWYWQSPPNQMVFSELSNAIRTNASTHDLCLPEEMKGSELRRLEYMRSSFPKKWYGNWKTANLLTQDLLGGIIALLIHIWKLMASMQKKLLKKSGFRKEPNL